MHGKNTHKNHGIPCFDHGTQKTFQDLLFKHLKTWWLDQHEDHSDAKKTWKTYAARRLFSCHPRLIFSTICASPHKKTWFLRGGSFQMELKMDEATETMGFNSYREGIWKGDDAEGLQPKRQEECNFHNERTICWPSKSAILAVQDE